MHFSLGTLLFWATALAALAMLRELWLSERARRLVVRARDEHWARERAFAGARRSERGDDN